MDKSKTLLIGCGGCGNNQLNDLMNMDRRYTGVFMNTNLSEMEHLKYFDKERRCFYIANADGTGKNKLKAESYLKEEAPKFISMVKKFINQDTVYLLAAMNGGTGAKAIEILSVLIKKACPDKSINLILTVPDMSEGLTDYENTLDTWNSIIKLKSDKVQVIDSILLIDNNYSTNEEEVNNQALTIFNDGIDILDGNLDVSDSNNVHRARGYKVILTLDKRVRDTKEAIDKAIQDSPFYMPSNFNANYVLANIDPNYFNIDVIKNEFKGLMSTKIHTNNHGKNIIVLGGCSMPIECVDIIKELHSETKKRKALNVNNDSDLLIDIDFTDTDNKPKAINNLSSRVTNDDLDDLFNDDLWDFLKR